MKTSNKLLLALLIVMLILITYANIMFRNILVKEINNNTEQRIELEQK